MSPAVALTADGGFPPQDEPSPEYWMAQLKAGREEALAHLMARFERPLFAFLGQADQEGRPVAAWLFTLAANAATDHLRRRGREVPPPETFDAPDPHQPSPWESVDQSRRIQALRGALEGLTPRQRAMVLAYYVHEHPVKRIAQDLGCAEGTVKATLFQSLQKLRKTLGPQP